MYKHSLVVLEFLFATLISNNLSFMKYPGSRGPNAEREGGREKLVFNLEFNRVSNWLLKLIPRHDRGHLI